MVGLTYSGLPSLPKDFVKKENIKYFYCKGRPGFRFPESGLFGSLAQLNQNRNPRKHSVSFARFFAGNGPPWMKSVLVT